MSARAWTMATRWAVLALLCVAPSAHAVVACSVAVSSVSIFYNPAGATVSTSALYTISCTRTLASEGPTVNYSLSSDLGANPQGGNRRATFSGSFYRYDLYKNSNYGPNDQWGTPSPASRAIVGSLTFGAGQLSVSTGGLPYYLQVLGGQAVGPAGDYLDTVIATLTCPDASCTGSASTPFTVTITSIANCAILAPTNLVFNYTSFQGAPATPSVNFTVNCTTGVPYTLALDSVGPITDDAVNLTYTLGLSAPSGTGAGVDQTYQVNGSMAGGQSGTCASAFCTNAAATNKTRTITITY